MSYTPGVGVDVTIGLSVGYTEPVSLLANRADDVAYLSIGVNVAEIRLQRTHLEALSHQLPGALADLFVLDVAEQRAAEAGNRAQELEQYLRDQADTADTAGEHDRAGDLRGTADKLKSAMEALDSALNALTAAAHAADDASDRAKLLLDEQLAREQSTGGDAA